MCTLPNNNKTQAENSFKAAMCRGVYPKWSGALGSAPADSSVRATSQARAPRTMAPCSGVRPSPSRARTSARLHTSSSTTSSDCANVAAIIPNG